MACFDSHLEIGLINVLLIQLSYRQARSSACLKLDGSDIRSLAVTSCVESEPKPFTMILSNPQASSRLFIISSRTLTFMSEKVRVMSKVKSLRFNPC